MTLYEAVAKGKTRQVRRLLKGGFLSPPKADINVNEKCDGLTPLHKAARSGNIEIVKLLLDYGADVNAKDRCNRTPLFRAAILAVNQKSYHNEPGFCGMIETCVLLLENGADPNDNFISFAGMGSADVCELLLKHGANVHARGFNDSTALHCTAEGRPGKVMYKIGIGEVYIKQTVEAFKQTISVLLRYGADIDAKDKFDRTPLHLVNNGSIADQLLAQGAHINAKDKDGRTLLHRAANKGLTQIVSLLLKRGADVHVKDKYGHTPLESVSALIESELAYDHDTILGLGSQMATRNMLAATTEQSKS